LISTVSSGSSTSRREADDAPGCLPGLRPDRDRDDRFCAGFFAHGASDDGGREDVDESAASRRFNSAISSACSPTTRRNSELSARSASTSANSWS
jgi:hypothetical protein